MSTATATRTRKQPHRSAKVARLGNSLILWLTVDRKTTAYRLVPLPSDFGLAMRLVKADKGDGQSEEYDVLLDGNRSSCECKGFLQHGMCKDGKGCKHLAGLQAVISSGQLADALPEPTEPESEEDATDSTEPKRPPSRPGSASSAAGPPAISTATAAAPSNPNGERGALRPRSPARRLRACGYACSSSWPCSPWRTPAATNT